MIYLNYLQFHLAVQGNKRNILKRKGSNGQGGMSQCEVNAISIQNEMISKYVSYEAIQI